MSSPRYLPFTPEEGPWSLTQKKEWPFHFLIKNAAGEVIVDAGLSTYSSNDEHARDAMVRYHNDVLVSNLQLMAAAREMYDALKLIQSHMRLPVIHVGDNKVCDLNAMVSFITKKAEKPYDMESDNEGTMVGN